MDILSFIKNSSDLYKLYDYWPSFHDGEIYTMNFGTFYKDNAYYSSYLEFTIHCWHMTKKIQNGYFVLENHNLVTFRFEDIHDLEIDGFGGQNIVLSLDFSVLEQNDRGFTPILVEIDPATGVGGEFKAFSAEIVKIQSCDQKGSVC